jgi:sialic acid synthase
MLKMGKKLVAARDLPAGHLLTAADVAVKSPGDGLPPYYLDQVLGQTLTSELHADDAITADLLSSATPTATGHVNTSGKPAPGA